MERTWRIMITLHPAVNLFLHLFTHWLTHLTYSFYPLSLRICIHRLYHIRREKGAVREGIWFFSSYWLIFLAYKIVQVTNKADDYATASNTGFSRHGFPPSLSFFFLPCCPFCPLPKTAAAWLRAAPGQTAAWLLHLHPLIIPSTNGNQWCKIYFFMQSSFSGRF